MTIAFAMFFGRHQLGLTMPLLLPAFMTVLCWDPCFFSMSLSFILIYRYLNRSPIAANILFYLLTNLQYWWAMDPHTKQGFIEFYASALPFLFEAYIKTICWIFIMEKIYEKFFVSTGIASSRHRLCR